MTPEKAYLARIFASWIMYTIAAGFLFWGLTWLVEARAAMILADAAYLFAIGHWVRF